MRFIIYANEVAAMMMENLRAIVCSKISWMSWMENSQTCVNLKEPLRKRVRERERVGVSEKVCEREEDGFKMIAWKGRIFGEGVG